MRLRTSLSWRDFAPPATVSFCRHKPQGPVDERMLGLMPGAWPTHEQYLDVFAGAIVATCRSVLNTPTPVRRLGENGVRIGATVEMAMSYEEVALACAGRPFEAQKPATRKAPLSTRRQRLRYLELHPEVTHAQDKVELLKNAGLVARSTYWRDVYV